ncbi:MAG: hypothetical protein D6714_13505 [Bacteroidetes bacterium]|nr:MAG: hypothetical protein D6714_13505 [Bacteroidota bacterium]
MESLFCKEFVLKSLAESTFAHSTPPFGMNMEGPWHTIEGNNDKYQYNGKELDEDFGINWYHYGFRIYDPAICRFTRVDPFSTKTRGHGYGKPCYDEFKINLTK